jgi:organic radical activating enzyme
MSDYLADAELAKARLAGVSGSFCLAKWKQVSLHLTTGHTNSCYHPPLHRIPTEPLVDNPSALHNTAHKKQRRAEMMEGVKCTECNYCWNIEQNGSLSDRHYRSGEPWAMEAFEDIVANPQADVNPSYVEVNFNHACNLKCSYCSPQFSSTWEQEAKEHGAYPTRTPHNDPAHFTGERKPIPNRESNPYREAFWRWWPDLYKDLKHFRMTGGEPTIDPNTYRVFDYVLENPKSDLHLNVTSNFSVDDRVFEKYLDYVKRLTQAPGTVEHFMQFVSLDTWGPQAEYIRHGLDFNLAINRVERFVQEVPERSSLTFIITMNNLSIIGLEQLLEYILYLRKTYTKTYQRIWFDTPLLYTPDWQNIQILPKAYEQCLWDCINFMNDNLDEMHGFKDYEVLKMRRDLQFMQKGTDNIERKRADFYRFFSEHDRRRGTNFEKTFPEMTEFWNECRFRVQTTST